MGQVDPTFFVFLHAVSKSLKQTTDFFSLPLSISVGDIYARKILRHIHPSEAIIASVQDILPTFKYRQRFPNVNEYGHHHRDLPFKYAPPTILPTLLLRSLIPLWRM